MQKDLAKNKGKEARESFVTLVNAVFLKATQKEINLDLNFERAWLAEQHSNYEQGFSKLLNFLVDELPQAADLHISGSVAKTNYLVKLRLENAKTFIVERANDLKEVALFDELSVNDTEIQLTIPNISLI